METVNKPKRTLIGEVISDEMDKTIVVKVERGFLHPRVKKYLKAYRKYKVHDENEQANVGDTVEIYEGRPVSKTKFMYLHRVINPTAGMEQDKGE